MWSFADSHVMATALATDAAHTREEPTTCPNCDARALNVQGVEACPVCDWTGR